MVFLSSRHCRVSLRYFFISSFNMATELLILKASSSLFFIADIIGKIMSSTMSLTSDILTNSPYREFILRDFVTIACTASPVVCRFGFTPPWSLTVVFDVPSMDILDLCCWGWEEARICSFIIGNLFAYVAAVSVYWTAFETNSSTLSPTDETDS